jgi:capsular polysaccharide biosynthesis protein/Mrp family chromosome partitioning ATPase
MDSSGSNSNSLIREARSEEFSDRFDTGKLLKGIPQHSLPVLICTVLLSLIGLLSSYYYLTTKVAESILVFHPEDIKELPGGIPFTATTLPTALDLIKVPVNLMAVKSTLNLNDTVKELNNSIDIPVPKYNSNIIRIVAKGPNSIDIANTLAKVSAKASQDYFKDQLKSALITYKEQFEFAALSLTKQLKEIEAFKKEHNYFDVDDKNTLFITRLQDVRKRLEESNMAFNSLLVEYENLKREADKYDEVYSTRKSNQDPVYLQTRMNQIETSLQDSRMKYAPDNPRLKVLENEYQRLKAEYQDISKQDDSQFITSPAMRQKIESDLIGLQGRVRSAQKNRNELQLLYDKLNEEVLNVPKEQIEFAKLIQQKKFNEDQVAFLNQAIERTQLLLNSPKGALTVYQLADKDNPLKDSLSVKLLPFIGAIFGFGLGVFIAFILEMTDDHFRTLKQLEMAYNVKPLLIIPEIKNLTKENSYQTTLFSTRDLSDRIDTILFQKEMKGKHFILTFLSSENNEGKTLIAYNLLKYYNHHNRKAVLLDFIDNKRDGKPTIIDYLKNEASLSDILNLAEKEPLHIGHGDPHLKELIKTPRMEELLTALKNKYEAVIIVAPGLILNDYAVNLAQHSELNLFIISSSDVTRSKVDTAMNQLSSQHVKPDGTILNKVPPLYVDDERILAELGKSNSYKKSGFRLWK